METAPVSPILTDEFLTNATAVITRLREEEPIHFIPGPDCWLATRYDDVRRLFTDPDFSADRRLWEKYEPPPAGSFRAWTEDHGLGSSDETHTRLRRLVSSALTPRAVRRMEDQVRDVVEQFAAPLRGRTGVIDMIAEYTNPIPNAVISRITGIPPKGGDEIRFRQLAQDVIRGFFTFASEEIRQRSDQASEEMADWVRTMAEERRSSPREDLVSDLVQVSDTDDRMTNDEVVSMISILVTAGSETTAMGGTFALRSLLRHPHELAKLRADRSLLQSAVNEILRFDFGDGGGIERFALRDVELRGVKIRKGQKILLSLGGAHRDPQAYPDPDRFDIERDNTNLIMFGLGPRYCLGANLARQEMRFIIDAALDFLPEGARLCEDQIRWGRTGFSNRMETLPVDFGG